MARAPRKPKPEAAAADGTPANTQPVPATSPEAAKENEPAPDVPEELEGAEFVLVSPVRMGGRRDIGATVILTREEHLLLRKAGAVAEDWPEES